MIELLISEIERVARFRPPEYEQDVMSSGEIRGDKLYITPEKYFELKKRYAQTYQPIASGSLSGSIKGMGDVVAKVAQPIAKVIDRVAGTNIQGCGGCKKRQEWLNKNIPFHR